MTRAERALKNSVQHAIANNQGEQAHMDFPKVDVEDIELEETAKCGESEAAAVYSDRDFLLLINDDNTLTLTYYIEAE